MGWGSCQVEAVNEGLGGAIAAQLAYFDLLVGFGSVQDRFQVDDCGGEKVKEIAVGLWQ